MVRVPLVAAVLLSGLCVIPACQGEPACTAVGADCGLVLEIRDAAGQRVPEGTYVVTIDGDGTTAELTCTVADDVRCGNDEVGDSGATGVSLGETDLLIDQVYPTFTLSLSRFEGSDHLGPETLAVTVRRDGAVVGSADVMPSYDVSEPWGDQCGECSRATVDLILEP